MTPDYQSTFIAGLDERFQDLAARGILDDAQFLAAFNDMNDNDFTVGLPDALLHPLLEWLDHFKAFMAYREVPAGDIVVEGPYQDETVTRGFMQLFGLSQAQINALYAILADPSRGVFARRDAAIALLKSW